MSEDQITMQVRPLEKIANDSRWTGAIEGDAYVLRVGPHVYKLRTVGVGTDDKGEYALVEPLRGTVRRWPVATRRTRTRRMVSCKADLLPRVSATGESDLC
jgi:hypothetical protein